jgi:hypothetical protein
MPGVSFVVRAGRQPVKRGCATTTGATLLGTTLAGAMTPTADAVAWGAGVTFAGAWWPLGW